MKQSKSRGNRLIGLRGSVMALMLAVCCVCLVGCPKKGDSVVLAGDGTRLSSEEIDRDPLALLPAGPTAVVHIDAKAAFASSMGTSSIALAETVFRLGKAANFDAQRDLRRLVLGVYSLQGADVVIVAQGQFDPDAISAAATGGAAGALTKLSYANNDLFVAGGLGFVVVTRSTLLAGTETGIRRALDRIRDKRLSREVPEWMVKLIDQPEASVVAAADLSSDPVVATGAAQAPFLQGLSVVRLLGNFEPPGLNIAGAMTYPDPESARRANESLQKLSQLSSYGMLLALLGIHPPIEKLESRVEKNDVQVIAALNGQSLIQFMQWSTNALKR